MSRKSRPSVRSWRAPAKRAMSLAAAVAMMLASPSGTPGPARAQDDEPKPPPIVRDAEIEQLLRDYTQPILHAAGLANQNVRVVIINDPTFNAFVMDGRRIFINSGALLQ